MLYFDDKCISVTLLMYYDDVCEMLSDNCKQLSGYIDDFVKLYDTNLNRTSAYNVFTNLKHINVDVYHRFCDTESVSSMAGNRWHLYFSTRYMRDYPKLLFEKAVKLFELYKKTLIKLLKRIMDFYDNEIKIIQQKIAMQSHALLTLKKGDPDMRILYRYVSPFVNNTICNLLEYKGDIKILKTDIRKFGKTLVKNFKLWNFQ